MSEPVTQKDFELFKKEIDNKFLEMKSDLSLFKQEMKANFGEFTNEIRNSFESYLLKIDSKTETVVNKRVRMVGGVIGALVLAFWAYFELSHNAINKTNYERASMQLEKTILAAMEKNMEKIQGKTQKTSKTAVSVSASKRATKAGKGK